MTDRHSIKSSIQGESMPLDPTPDTDNARLLDALKNEYPSAIWDANEALGMTANSRAAELRSMGWDVRSTRMRDPRAPKGRRYGYRLETPPELWSVAVDPDGQLRIA